jgi:hypothetical protein
VWRARQACQLRCIANRAGRLNNPAMAPSQFDPVEKRERVLPVCVFEFITVPAIMSNAKKRITEDKETLVSATEM